jgi:hypothetical protein
MRILRGLVAEIYMVLSEFQLKNGSIIPKKSPPLYVLLRLGVHNPIQPIQYNLRVPDISSEGVWSMCDAP